MNALIRRAAAGLCATGLFLCAGSLIAQQERNPIPVLNGMITQFQTGTPLWNWYSPQLWEKFRGQTWGTGVSIPLQQLGVVRNIVINGALQLPEGSLYSMTAFHDFGRSDWRIGINKYSDRIEYVDSAIGQQQPFSLPNPNPAPVNPNPSPSPGPLSPIANPPQPQPTNPKPNPDPKTSEACQQFPDLC